MHQHQLLFKLLAIHDLNSAAGAVELRNSLGEKYNIELPPSLALDFPTASAIATHIASLIGPSKAVVSSNYSSKHSDWDPRSAVWTARLDRADTDATAIVGMSARYPGGVSSPAGFWTAISASVDLPQQVGTRMAPQSGDSMARRCHKMQKRHAGS